MKFLSLRKNRRVKLIISCIVFLSISSMLFGCAHTTNHKYGVYTIEEMKSLNIDDPIVDKTKTLMSDYQMYFSKKFSTVEVTERIYYLENNISAKIRVFVHNDEKDKPWFSLDIDTTKDQITHLNLRLNRSYTGEFKESMDYIDKEQLAYVAEYFEIQDAYNVFENTFKDIKPNAENVYASYTYDDKYEITTKEQYYPEEKIIELEYVIDKTY